METPSIKYATGGAGASVAGGSPPPASPVSNMAAQIKQQAEDVSAALARLEDRLSIGLRDEPPTNTTSAEARATPVCPLHEWLDDHSLWLKDLERKLERLFARVAL